jgi:hypothetical protein
MFRLCSINLQPHKWILLKALVELYWRQGLRTGRNQGRGAAIDGDLVADPQRLPAALVDVTDNVGHLWDPSSFPAK